MTYQTFFKVASIILFLIFMSAYISSIKVPRNIFIEKMHTGIPYVVGRVDDKSCVLIENFDPGFSFGRGIYFVNSGDTRYEIYDVDITGKGDLRRVFITRDMTLCQSLVSKK